MNADEWAMRLTEGSIKADEAIARMRQGGLSAEEFEQEISSYVHARFLLPSDCNETDLYRLAVESIRILDGGKTQEKELLARIERPDCHHTGSAVHKKTLLIMGLERQLEVLLAEDAVEQVVTLQELSEILYEAMNGRQRNGWKEDRRDVSGTERQDGLLSG